MHHGDTESTEHIFPNAVLHWKNVLRVCRVSVACYAKGLSIEGLGCEKNVAPDSVT